MMPLRKMAFDLSSRIAPSPLGTCASFKNAEFLAEQGDFFSSANEFLRLYEEVPDDQRYVEPALWNAGINYRKRAIGFGQMKPLT